MKLVYFSFSILMLFSSCSSSSNKEQELLQKENELLKRELAIQKREKEVSSEPSKTQKVASKPKQSTRPNLPIKKKKKPTVSTKQKKEIVENTIISLHQSLNSGSFSKSRFESNGDFWIDLGSYSLGRLSGNIKDMDLTMEFRAEEPGCADICPDRILISFNCKGCIGDPYFHDMEKTDEAVLQFFKISQGKNIFYLLETYKKNIR